MAGDLNHLEKMGRELKCPICLSLLNSAVSLNCNHVFCDSCIAKSMKSDSHCPVCKIPCRRREVRPAPHMDNLVSIYKSMETSSGMNIFITQNVSSTKLSDENLQGEGSAHIRPSFPNKKRVQVPQTQSQGGVSEAAVRLSENSSRARKSNTDEGGEPALSPFFWLRDEENEEDLSQLSGKSPFHDGPFPDIPTFSDMKESDDETSNRDEVGKFPKLPDMFDSEMFEWTQRACSPELCSSPFKTQAVDTNIIKGKDLKKASNGRKRGKRVLAKNVKLMTTRHDDQRNIDTCGTGNPNEFSCKKSTKRGQKASKTVGTKCYVYDTDPELQIIRDSLSGKDTDPELDIIRDSDKRTPEMYKGRRRNSKVQFSDVGTKRRHENVCIDEFGKSLVAAAPPGKKKRFKNENTFVKSGNKGKKIHANNQSEHHVGSEEELESDVNNFGEASTKQTLANNDTIAQLSDLLVPLACKHKASESKNSSGYLTRQSKSGDGPSSKRISKMSSKCSSKEGISDEIRASHVNNLCTAEIPTTGNIQNNVYTKTSADPLTVKKFPCQTNDGVLQRCGNNLGKIQCAFCLSSQESEASGEMVHYYNGRPVAADYKGGSKVIHSHRNCTEWAPNVYFEDDVAINLEAELVRSRKIKCSCCGVKGAALGCYDKSCRKSFHVTCSKLMPQCRWDMDNFVMLCPLHPADNFPSERLQSQARASKCNMIKQPDPQPSKNAVKHDLNTSACWSASGSSKRCVLCCSALTDSEREIVSEFERISGISVSKKWKSSVTHVIASIDENGACKRTLKVMMGILDGKWILSIKWIQACIDAMKLVDEESFEITCDAHGVSNGPQLGRLRIQNKLPRLFDGFKFYFMGEFVTSYKGYLRDLITAAGGTILQRRPVSEYQDDLLSDSLTCQTFIIYSLEPPDQSRTSVNTDAIFNLRRRDAEAVARSSEAKVVTNSWVLNSIAACKVQSLGE